ncbi:MAG: 4Fe-4S ferredoxin, partial [Deltaproteobacteria bacterium]|nr:4Fe-4S ferredoxin [Deltaproteobacteria bacterium]
MARWGMVINLYTCIGCYNCMISCKQEHFLPPGIFFARVLVGESGKYPSVQKLIYPV